jgi:Protein of unknown function (DUF3574)
MAKGLAVRGWQFGGLALAAALSGALAGCAPSAADTPLLAAAAGLRCQPQSVARLYFGAQMPDGVVDEAAWEGFVAGEVAARFVAGFTVLEARGQWRGEDGVVFSEHSRVLEIVGEDSLATRARLAELVAIYKQRFRQQAVLVTQTEARACL